MKLQEINMRYNKLKCEITSNSKQSAWLVGWLVGRLRIYVEIRDISAISDSEAGDNQSLKS